jgi:hypothetical protein
MEFTQEQLNILGFNYKCCFSNKGEEMVKRIQKGLDCTCLNRELLFLEMLIDIVNCYTIGTIITHKPEIVEFVDAEQVEYTTEELNCLTTDQLTDIIEFINQKCDCCI